MYVDFIKGFGFQNVYKGGQITGFQFKIHLPYYRGLWVSQAFQGFAVTVDGVEYPLDKVSIKIGDRVFPWAQINGAYDVFWYYGEPATILVDKQGGLTAGLHKVTCGIQYARSYNTKLQDSNKVELFAEMSYEVGEHMSGLETRWYTDTADLVLVI